MRALVASVLALACGFSVCGGVVGCSGLTRGSELMVIQGSFGYRERILPPPDAIAMVSLQDVSRADARASVLAHSSFRLEGAAPPYDYTLSTAAGELDPRSRYVVRVEIRSSSDDLLWTTDSSVPIDPAAGDQQVEPITLVRVQKNAGARAGAGARAYELEGAEWQVENILGEAVIGNSSVNLEFESGELVGSTGCNRFRGPVELGPNRSIRVSQLAVTRRACVPALEVQQERFLQSLGAATRYDVLPEGLLIIHTSDGDIRARRG